jgi:hypothetical protein
MENRRKVFAAIQEVLSASAEISGEVAKRLERVAGLFGVEATGSRSSKVTSLDPKAKAS